MPNKRKICTENINSNQSIYIASLNSYYQPESVLNSAYRKVLDFKENAEKILEKEKSETLSLTDFSKAILDSRSFEISLQHNCIKLKCYITLEKDKDAKKKMRNGVSECSSSPSNNSNNSPLSSYDLNEGKSSPTTSGGAKKVNVEVIMKSNPFRVEENEKTTRMELIKNSENCNGGGNMLRFTYYVKPECEKLRETNSELFEKGRLVVFTNDFFTVYQDTATGEMNISLNEIVQSQEEQKRTEALGEKLFLLLKDRPRHRALLTNECKLNHTTSSAALSAMANGTYYIDSQQYNNSNNNNSTSQEDETFYTRELIQIYGQPIVPSFHKYFNYQLSNTHYGYRTLRRLLNCDILKKFVKITKEEIKSLDRVVEFVQLTPAKCMSAFQLNLTSFYDPARFEHGIVKNWLDVWYVDRLKEKYAQSSPNTTSSSCSSSSSSSPSPNNSDLGFSSPSSSGYYSSSSSSSSLPSPSHSHMHTSASFSGISSWAVTPNDPISSWSGWSNSASSSSSNSASGHSGLFVHHSNCDSGDSGDEFNTPSECDQANHLWFCLRDYACTKMSEFLLELRDYIQVRTNRSELILVQTAHPVFEYKHVLSEARRILTLFLSKSTINKTLDELIGKQFPVVAREHIENLLSKFLIMDADRKVVAFTALFEILMILKRELSKEKNDEMKYSHFLCTLERANQEKLKMAIVQLKCVPCLNKFTTNFTMSPGQSQSTSHLSGSYSSNQMLKSSNSNNMVSQANMSRLLKQMSLIVSTELQQIAIDLYEKMEESSLGSSSSSSSGEKPVKYIKLKDEFRHSSSSPSISSSPAAPSMMPLSHSSPQFKSMTSSASSSQVGSSSTPSPSPPPQPQPTSHAPTLQPVAKQQLNTLLQMNSLAASFKKVDLTKPSPSGGAKQGPPPMIFNPKKDLEQFMAKEKKNNTDLSSFRSTASSFFYSDSY